MVDVFLFYTVFLKKNIMVLTVAVVKEITNYAEMTIKT